MKKIAFAILSSLILSLSSGTFAFVQTPQQSDASPTRPDLREYYSESLGTDDENKVFHITACHKSEAYAPLRCNEATADFARTQCRGRDNVINDVLIKACLKVPNQTGPNGYPEVDRPYNVSGCPNPEAQSFVYEQEWGVVKKGDLSDFDTWETKGTIVHPSKPNQDMVRRLFPRVERGVEAEPRFRPDVCVTWDVNATNQNITISGTSGTSFQADYFGNGAPAQALANSFNAKISVSSGYAPADCNKSENASIYNGEMSLTCSILYVITGQSGADIFGKYISMLYKWAASIVGIISVLVMVFSGVQISMAGGDTAKIDSAKNRIMQSIIGLVLLFLSGVILYAINPGFFTG